MFYWPFKKKDNSHSDIIFPLYKIVKFRKKFDLQMIA